jgi:TRAP-type C4-dicarboxylate transport system permease small subunit
MPIVLAAARLLAGVNAPVLAVGRWIAIVLMALMVLVILAQIFMRFVMNDALPWSEEAARFMMLWVAGVAAPTAYRRGGFVAIDMVILMLPRLLGGLITLALLILSLVVLVVAVQIGWSEVTGFAGSFKTAALKTVFVISFTDAAPWFAVEWGWQKMPRSQMMASLLVGFFVMVIITVELILRSIVTMAGRGDDLPEIPESATVGAE